MTDKLNDELIVVTSETQPLIEISTDSHALITIEKNGTVIIHKEGGDKEAAKAFYGALEREGTTLYAKIKELEEENKKLKEQVNEI